MNMRNVLVVILVLVLVVVCVFTVTDYLSQRGQTDALNEQIAAATDLLLSIPQTPADLDQRLAAAQDELAAVKETFAVDTNYTRIVKKILEIAAASGVKAIPLSTQPWTLETVADQEYSVFRLDLAVHGNYLQLVDFLRQLENGDLKTLVIEYLNVEAVPGASLLDAAGRAALTLSADVKIVVYAAPMVSG